MLMLHKNHSPRGGGVVMPPVPMQVQVITTPNRGPPPQPPPPPQSLPSVPARSHSQFIPSRVTITPSATYSSGSDGSDLSRSGSEIWMLDAAQNLAYLKSSSPSRSNGVSTPPDITKSHRCYRSPYRKRRVVRTMRIYRVMVCTETNEAAAPVTATPIGTTPVRQSRHHTILGTKPVPHGTK